MAVSAKLIGKRLGSVTDQLLRQVYEEGFTLEEIAKQIKCAQTTVSSRIVRAGGTIRTSADYKAPPKKKVNINDTTGDVDIRRIRGR